VFQSGLSPYAAFRCLPLLRTRTVLTSCTYAPMQGVVTAATGAGLTVVLRRALRDPSGMHSSGLGQGKEAGVTTVAVPPPPPPQPEFKPANDVVAGAVARAASQSTIHPLDTMKVRMQTSSTTKPVAPPRVMPKQRTTQLQRNLHEVKGLYKVRRRGV
jgi:hypothetical protein